MKKSIDKQSLTIIILSLIVGITLIIIGVLMLRTHGDAEPATRTYELELNRVINVRSDEDMIKFTYTAENRGYYLFDISGGNIKHVEGYSSDGVLMSYSPPVDNDSCASYLSSGYTYVFIIEPTSDTVRAYLHQQ
jgi:hypothetical protein